MRHILLSQLADQAVSHNSTIRKQVMLKAGDLPHLTQFAVAEFPPGQVASAHIHTDMHEVFFVQLGTGAIEIDGTSYDLHPGVCILVEPNERHEIINTSQEVLRLVYFGIQS